MKDLLIKLVAAIIALCVAPVLVTYVLSAISVWVWVVLILTAVVYVTYSARKLTGKRKHSQPSTTTHNHFYYGPGGRNR